MNDEESPIQSGTKEERHYCRNYLQDGGSIDGMRNTGYYLPKNDRSVSVHGKRQ